MLQFGSVWVCGVFSRKNLSSLTWSPDGNFLTYICSGIIELWNLRTDKLKILYREQAPPFNIIAFSSNSQQSAYLTAGYDLGLVDLTTTTTIGKRKLRLDSVGEAVWLGFSDDDQILYTPKGRIDIASFFSDGVKPRTRIDTYYQPSLARLLSLDSWFSWVIVMHWQTCASLHIKEGGRISRALHASE